MSEKQQRSADVELEELKRSLEEVNALAVDLASLPPAENLHRFLAQRLKEMTGAVMTTFGVYDQTDRTIVVRHLELEPGFMGAALRLLGKQVSEVRSPVSEETYREIVGEVVGNRRTLTDVSFGAVPPVVGAAIQKLLRVDRFIGMAYIVEKELFGTSVIGLKAGQPDPPLALLRTFANVVAVHLRRRKAEEALKKSEEFFRTSIELTNQLPWTTSAGGEVVDDVPHWRKFTGLSYEEIKGTGWVKSIHPDDVENTKKVWDNAVNTKTPYETEYRVRRFDGVYQDFLARGVPLKDESGNIVLWEGVCINITERKKAEEALWESRERHRALFENGILGVSLIDTDYKIVQVNPTFAGLFNKPADELKGKFCFREYEKREAICAHCPGKRAMVSGKTEEVETQGVRDDGSRFWVHLRAVPLIGKDGAVSGFMEIVEDIDAQKKTAEALRESEAKYRLLTEKMNDIVWTMSMDFSTTFASPSFKKVLGFTPEEAGKIPFTQRMTRESVARCMEVFQEQLRLDEDGAGDPERTVRFETEYYHKNGSTVWVENVISAIRDEKGKAIGFHGVGRDITERKRAEQLLLERTLELERSNQDLERFAYIISHDLQEPLRAMSEFSRIIGDKYRDKLDEKGRKYLGFIELGAIRMKEMTLALLDYSRVGRADLRIRAVETRKCAEAALDNLSVAIGECGAEVVLGALPEAKADRDLLARVFQNLIGNAVKFRGEGKPAIRVGASRGESEWVFSVADNGIGIDPAHIGKLFNVFQRLHTRNEYPGTGIGLAICRNIVERHGGRIWVESKPGEGSTFYFTIPEQR